MKKIGLVIAFLWVSTVSFAQAAFDKFDDKEGVTSVVVTKKMFEMMSKVKVDAKDKDTQQYLNLLKKLENLRVFSTANAKVGADMKATVNNYLKSNPLEELMRVTDEGKNVKVYIKSGANENIVKELLMFVEGANLKDANTIILSLIGNFSLDEISMLTEKMNLPGADDLKKASKK
jgi:alpha-acetolactate decarboxylase